MHLRARVDEEIAHGGALYGNKFVVDVDFHLLLVVVVVDLSRFLVSACASFSFTHRFHPCAGGLADGDAESWDDMIQRKAPHNEA